jgi:hypothetical protein
MQAAKNVNATAFTPERIAEMVVAAVPRSLSQAERYVVELRDRLEAVRTEVAEELREMGNVRRSSPTAEYQRLARKIADIEESLRPARTSLAAEREAFVPKFHAALTEPRRAAGEAITGALPQLDAAAMILASIERQAMLQGLTTVAGASWSRLSVAIAELKALAALCGVQA